MRSLPERTKNCGKPARERVVADDLRAGLIGEHGDAFCGVRHAAHADRAEVLALDEPVGHLGVEPGGEVVVVQVHGCAGRRVAAERVVVEVLKLQTGARAIIVGTSS